MIEYIDDLHIPMKDGLLTFHKRVSELAIWDRFSADPAFSRFYRAQRGRVTLPVSWGIDPDMGAPICMTLTDLDTLKAHGHIITLVDADNAHEAAHELCHALLNETARYPQVTTGNTSNASATDRLPGALNSFVEDRRVEAVLKSHGFTLPALRFQWRNPWEETPEQERDRTVALQAGLMAALSHWIDELCSGQQLDPDPALARYPAVQKAAKRVTSIARRFDLDSAAGAAGFYHAVLRDYNLRGYEVL